MFLKYGFSTNLKGIRECITNFTIFVFNSFAFVYLFASHHQVCLDNKIWNLFFFNVYNFDIKNFLTITLLNIIRN